MLDRGRHGQPCAPGTCRLHVHLDELTADQTDPDVVTSYGSALLVESDCGVLLSERGDGVKSLRTG
jgi:hypothetical protein